MRLWHYKLLPYLPKSQLIAQWRELNSIFKKQNKHILINYIYGYPKDDLISYTRMVIDELKMRGYTVDIHNFENYFGTRFGRDETYWVDTMYIKEPFRKHHNNRYLLQCFYNLQEKYDRGQQDFDYGTYWKLLRFMHNQFADFKEEHN